MGARSPGTAVVAGLQGLAEAVERPFSWIDQYRRMSKDYERSPETGDTFI